MIRNPWVAVLLGGLVLLGCQESGQKKPQGRLRVAVSILPLKSLVERVGDHRVQVTVLVPPGASPHTFEPRPEDVKALAQADLVVFVGMGLEDPWGYRLVESAGKDPSQVVELARGITPTPDSNPHVWLSPKNGRILVQNLVAALSQRDPAHAQEYQARGDTLIQALDSLHQVYLQRFSSLKHRAFVATHAAWSYLARDYGLEQVAVLQKKPGAEPSARQVAEIVRLMRQRNVRVVIVEPQLPEKAAQTLASETGAQVIRLDPLGVATGHTDYLDLLAYDLETLWKALEQSDG